MRESATVSRTVLWVSATGGRQEGGGAGRQRGDCRCGGWRSGIVDEACAAWERPRKDFEARLRKV